MNVIVPLHFIHNAQVLETVASIIRIKIAVILWVMRKKNVFQESKDLPKLEVLILFKYTHTHTYANTFDEHTSWILNIKTRKMNTKEWQQISIYNLLVWVCMRVWVTRRIRITFAHAPKYAAMVKVFELFIEHQPIRQTRLLLNIIWSLFSSLSISFIEKSPSFFQYFFCFFFYLNHFQRWHVFLSSFVPLNFIMKRENIQ